MNKPVCSVCGNGGVVPVLRQRVDREYGITARLNYYQCAKSGCRHVQVFPLPDNELIATFYNDYTTHEVSRLQGLGSFVARLSELLADRQIATLKAGFPNEKKVRILDYGCGNGVNLARLARKGFANLVGFDFDRKAADCVHGQGFECYTNWAELSRSGKFDIVLLYHVIEHLPNPQSSLSDISSLLSPNGQLVIRTPNARSFLASVCGDNWRGWETPRHLNVFTFDSLNMLLNKNPEFEDIKAYTSNDMSLPIAIASLPSFIARYKPVKISCAFFMAMIGIMLSLFFRGLGEELVFKIVKR